MPLKSKRSPAEGEFLFEIDEQPTEECLTALGGLPLFVRTARSLYVPGSVKRNLALKQSEDSGAVKECAAVEYYPEETAANRYRRGSAVWAVWGECRLVPPGGGHLQHTDRDEATGPACGFADGAAQAATVSRAAR